MKDSFFTDQLDVDEMTVDEKIDYTDHIDKERQQKRIFKIVSVLIVLALILAGSFMLYTTVFSNNNEVGETYFDKGQSLELQQSEDYIANINAPFYEMYPNAPIVEAGQILTQVDGKTITAGANVLTFTNSEISSIINSCEVIQPTDFCLAGIAKFNNSDVNIYFMKDAVRSRLFENPALFEKFEVNGSPAAALVEIVMGTEKGNVLVVANKDSSGFMLALPNDMPMDEIQALSKDLKIS